MTQLLVDDLRKQIADRQAIAIVGAGVSIGATNNAPVASWVGLLKDGIARCEAVAGVPAGWADRQRAALDTGDVDELLGVAEQVSRRLGYPDGGEWRRWLRETVGQLKVQHGAALEALRDLHVPIATTNYDSLIEETMGWPAATWRDGAQVERVLRGDDTSVLHLHGHWQDPASVVLGIRSYEAVLGDPHAQAVLRSLRLRHTLVFIGCGAGLGDPNLGALLVWSRPVLAGSEYRHFRLCRKQEREELERQHPPEERIFLLPFGKKHEDLAPFLRGLAPGRGSNKHGKSAPDPDVVALPPKPPRCIGRDEEVETLIGALLAAEPTTVLGPPGIGKSTTCVQALRDPRIAEHFGPRRYFVRLDGARTAKDLLAAVGAVLGIPAEQARIGTVIGHLAERPAALALDNLETPWQAETLATEALLANLAGAPGLSLAVTLRMGHQPGGVAWRESIEVKPLGREDASRVFLAIAGQKHAADPQLDSLLKALDGVPLAIELLAFVAQAEPDLQGIWQRWQTERTAMLKRGASDHRLLSLSVSLELSIESPSMTDAARRLLSILALLPDGIARDDLEKFLPGLANAAAATLRQVVLAFYEAGRLRVLAPIREHAILNRPPTAKDLARAINHYVGLAASLSPKCGWEGGQEAVARLSADAANIERMLLFGLQRPEPQPVVEVVIAFSEFQRFSGLGTADALDRAVLISKSIDDRLAADAAFRRGLLAFARSDHDGARERYEAALPLYSRVGDVLGEANCMKGLGDIALALSDHDSALSRYDAGLSRYRQAGSALGMANCMQRLADIALVRRDYPCAQRWYEMALPYHHQLGSVLAEGNCSQGLGKIAFECSDLDSAREHYHAARSSYQRVGYVVGEAYCAIHLGIIARARSDFHAAREFFDEALGLCGRNPVPYLIGWAHKLLADLARNEDERVRHRAAAREAWLSVGRNDLVRLIDEADSEDVDDPERI